MNNDLVNVDINNDTHFHFAKDFVKFVNEDLLQIKQPHFDIAFRLHEAKERGYPELLNYPNIYALAETEFGFKKSATANYISVCAEYMDCTPRLRDVYADFSFSQLVEMLPIVWYERCNIKSTMTVRQIRDWRKCLKENFDTVSKSVQTSGNAENEKVAEQIEYEIENEKIECENLPVQTSGKIVLSKIEVQKKSLLNFKNKQQREEFLDNYKDWGVWLEVPELLLTCYKYKFCNGAELVVTESYQAWSYDVAHEPRLTIRYHLVNDEVNFFDLTGIARTYVIQWLTEKRSEV